MEEVLEKSENTEQNTPLKERKKKREIENPLWVSVSEGAKIGGVQTKTIRRAIQANSVKFKVVGNRYQIDLESLIRYLHSNTKLNNKLLYKGIGQYVDKYNIENLLEE